MTALQNENLEMRELVKVMDEALQAQIEETQMLKQDAENSELQKIQEREYVNIRKWLI